MDDAALKEKVAFSSIIASTLLTIGKVAAGLASGSLALLSEGAHNLVDTGATILTYFAVRQANKPADDRHHYGHSKFESLLALAETGLLAGLACFVLFAAIERLWKGGEPVDASWPVFAVLFVSIAVDISRVLTLRAVAKKTKSQALAADAMHFASDLVASVLVVLGLVAGLFGYHQGDALAAIGVAAFIAYAGYHLGRETIETLLDTAPEGLADSLRSAIARIPGVVAVESVKLRAAGPQVLGEITVAVSRMLAVERLTEVEGAVHAKIAEISPDVEASILTVPRMLDDETMAERIALIAARKKLSVHRVFVHQRGGVECVAFDIEVDGAMSHGQAHDIATGLENDIRADLGGDIEVESHIEPLQDHAPPGQAVDAVTLAAISEVLSRAARDGGLVKNVSHIRAQMTEDGVVVNFHGMVEPGLSVAETHAAMDAIEGVLRAKTPGVMRVIGHAEPPAPIHAQTDRP